MKWILSILFIALIGGSVGYWLLSPLFITIEVNDTVPTLKSQTVERTITEATVTATTTPLSTTLSVPTDSESPDSFPISATFAHPASGSIRVIETPDERIIRYENYEGTNGPDLRVYLASDLEATEFIDLGPARGNKGNINYSVPMDVDINDYPYVLTWCRGFGVLFDYAKIN